MMGRNRRGSALILVLLMTLAVAALAIAAIFMSSSAGLLSRFYDKERSYRYAAESAIALVQSRLLHQDLAIPDTGMSVVLSGVRIPRADGSVDSSVRVTVYAATTGDTTGRGWPFVTVVAQAFDNFGTRHVRRADLRRTPFSRYALVADTFNTGFTFGPGVVDGRVHSNQTWRSASGTVYRDTVTAVEGFAGSATYASDTTSAVAPMRYPADSTYAGLTVRADSFDLLFAPVSGGARGSRLEFVAFDADADGSVEVGESFARVFDLAAGRDTSRLVVPVDTADFYFFGFGRATLWTDPIVQNQCGAFYYRGTRWMFFPVATHRAAWARNVLLNPGGSNYPVPNPPTMNTMDDYSYAAVSAILQLPTARCFPAGSPFLLTTERFTNSSGVVTGTAADTVPFGVVTPPGGWPASAPNGYGGSDTTFTVRSRTCTISTGGTSGRCDGGTIADLGSWRAFGGTAVTGIANTVRQSAELPMLWPINAAGNTATRNVMRATGGPLFLSGRLRGELTLLVDGSVRIIDALTYVSAPADPATPACADQLGIVAVGDILVADNALMRVRRIAASSLSSTNFVRHFGSARDLSIHANLMSLRGTVGTAGAGRNAISSNGLECPRTGGAANSASGCFLITGAMVMRRYTPLQTASTAGFRWAGTADRCQSTFRRPPFFPLTNRYTRVRTVEIEAARANTPPEIRALLMGLKGKSL